MSALGGATLVVAGCDSDPIEKLFPLHTPPYGYVSGNSIHFATTCQECTAACGLIIRTREGRAIKAEGNPNHPLSEGRICLQGQSILQALYSPARASYPKTIINKKSQKISWEQGEQLLADKLIKLKNEKGGILLIGPPRTGTYPTLLKQWISAMGGGTLLEFDMKSVNSIKEANKILFGKPEIPHYAIDKAEMLINFGADFLETWLNPVQMTKNYTRMHKFQDGSKGRYIHIAPHISLTGTNADEWHSCPVGHEMSIALAISNALLETGAKHLSDTEKIELQELLKDFSIEKVAKTSGIDGDVLGKLAQDFNKNGDSLAIAGGNCNAGNNATQLQIAVNILNYVAGNIGNTIILVRITILAVIA